MSKCVAFWSPTGVGASTLLLNTAAALGARKANLVTVDLNLTAPSLALYTDLLPYEQPQETCLSRILPSLSGGRLTMEELARRLLPGPGFMLLPGMLDAVGASRLTEGHVKQILRVLSTRFDLMLVDVTAPLDSVACLPVLELADLICLVVGPEIASRFHTRRFLLPLTAMGLGHKIALVYNRGGSPPGDQVALDLGLPVAHFIPELKSMNGFLEEGRLAYATGAALPAMKRFRTAVDGLASLIVQGGERHARD
jgi:MinD-like ATPase involved in chromosome partitioning or flagellar assembly